MEEPGFFRSRQVCILGLGLMGGSLALALQGKCKRLVGVDPNHETRDLAMQLGVVDQVSEDPCELLPHSDLVVLAAPVAAIIQLLHDLPKLHPGSAVVIDFGSTKTQIVQAMQSLPERFDPLGGHPICGKERSSLKFASADLFQEAPFALVPLERTSAYARSTGEQLARAVGACPLWIDPVAHDRSVAATSHLPYLISNALAAVTPLDAAVLLGPGFRSTARLSVSDLDMSLDILNTNRDNVLVGLRSFQEQLAQVEALLAKGDLDALRNLLGKGSKRYDQLCDDRGGS